MTELTVTRWRRYGKDRLHVNDADGSRVGWVDLQTDEVVCDRESLREEFERAVRSHHDLHTAQRSPQVGTTGEPPSEPSPAAPLPPQRSTSPPPSVPPPPPSPPVEPEPPASASPRRSPDPVDDEPFAVTLGWQDLATRDAGAAAAEQARAERVAAPVRTLVARLLGVHTEERAWRIGATGERLVAARLEKLPAPWRTLHAVPVGDRGSDIDHVVVGPGGVFTINAKHHPDANVWVGGNTFMVNGQRQPYVRNSRHEARRAARLLSVALGWPVQTTGVIAVVGARRGFTVEAQPRGVHVVARTRIGRWLTSLPPVLRVDQIETIHAAGRRSDTWR